jgi:hypothetical protein
VVEVTKEKHARLLDSLGVLALAQPLLKRFAIVWRGHFAAAKVSKSASAHGRGIGSAPSGAVVELIEDDGKDKTKVYVDVSKKDATVRDRWVKDFIAY